LQYAPWLQIDLQPRASLDSEILLQEEPMTPPTHISSMPAHTMPRTQRSRIHDAPPRRYRCHGHTASALSRVLVVFAYIAVGGVAHAEEPPPEPPKPARADAPQVPDCARMLLEAASALRNEQYPSMAKIGAERQRTCPGPDSLFLVGIAKANMIHNGLVARESESLVRAQAIRALTSALDSDALRGEWLQPANAWLQYLQRAERDEKRALPPPAPPAPTPTPTIIPPAAPPWEPEPSHLGPLLLASAGIGLLGAGLVTAIIAANRGPFDDSSTLNTATEVLVLSGGAALVSALTWHLLTPQPRDYVQVSLSTSLPHRAAFASMRMSF
jgi:hypothetical protein